MATLSFDSTPSRKRVLLLAVSCKNGGLCPGGIDLDYPKNWIRIVSDDGQAGAVQGYEIDFAKPLDVITFDGRPMPQGKQQENWVIDNHSCKRLGKGVDALDVAQDEKGLLLWAYQKYSYHGFWNNYKAYLNEAEFESVTAASESILLVSDVRIYKNDYGSAKIDFSWGGSLYPLRWISMTDQDFYDQIDDENEVTFDKAFIVISIPKECDWVDPRTGEAKAYKFVSRIYGF